MKRYEERNFGGGTEPLYMQINNRKEARNIKASLTVIEEESSPIHYNDENDGFSQRRKQRSQSKSKTKKITNNVSSSKWDDSFYEASFDDLSQEESSENVTSDEVKRLNNERSMRSSAFMIALKNMKEFGQKTSMIDMGEQDKYHKFHVSSGRNNPISYTVDIRRELKCTCEYIVQKNAPCKHVLYIMMKVLNVKESSYILQQIYLTKKEIKNLFNCCVAEKGKSSQMTPKAMLKTISSVTSLYVPQQKQVSLTRYLPRKPFLPEPQNVPYGMVKRSGAIRKCRGHKEGLNEVVMGRIEIDLFPKADPTKQSKYWAVAKKQLIIMLT